MFFAACHYPWSSESVLTELILEHITFVTFLRNPIFCFDPGSKTLVSKQVSYFDGCPSNIALNKNVSRKAFAREVL
jgi:hypothetical protein